MIRGLSELADFRRRGKLPASVAITVDMDMPDWYSRGWSTPLYPGCSVHALLVVEPGTNLGVQDLRPVCGLKVSVDGRDLERVHAVGKACEEALALRVITSVCTTGDGPPEVIELTDTDGVLQWHR